MVFVKSLEEEQCKVHQLKTVKKLKPTDYVIREE